MKCIFCELRTHVHNVRQIKNGVRRWRSCDNGHTFTTEERHVILKRGPAPNQRSQDR